jgi:mRNA interferase MazF
MIRGDVYFIKEGSNVGGDYTMRTGRPAVIVSSDTINENAKVVEIVFLTTAPKRNNPYHVTFHCRGKLATALCEQVTSVDIDNLDDYMCTLSEKDMANVSKAISASLGLCDVSEGENFDRESLEEKIDYWKNKYIEQLAITAELLK